MTRSSPSSERREGKANADKPDKASNAGDSPAGRAARRGRSGYGIESLRPHLREQLEMKELLRPSFPGSLGPNKLRLDD